MSAVTVSQVDLLSLDQTQIREVCIRVRGSLRGADATQGDRTVDFAFIARDDSAPLAFGRRNSLTTRSSYRSVVRDTGAARVAIRRRWSLRTCQQVQTNAKPL